MWVTVLASQPSVSMQTDTTQRICSPSLPGLPIVFITSRSRSSSVRSSVDRPGKRSRYSALNSSISAAAIFLNSGLIASPDSSCFESTRMVLGRSVHWSCSTLLNRWQVAGGDRRHVVGQWDLPPRDPVVDQLADVGVVADDDEDRRREVRGIGAVAGGERLIAHLLPEGVGLLVVAVQTVERALQLVPAAWAARHRSRPRSCDPSWAARRGCAARAHGRSAGRRSWRRRRPARAAP